MSAEGIDQVTAGESTDNGAKPAAFPWKKHLDAVQAAVAKSNDSLAEQLLQVLLDVSAVLPVESSTSVGLAGHLGYIEIRKGSLETAKQQFARALKMAEDAGLSEHPCVALCLDGLAECFQKSGDYKEAEKQRRKAVTIADATLGAEHPQTGFYRERLESLREEQLLEGLGNDEGSKTLFDRLSDEYKPELAEQTPVAPRAEGAGMTYLWEKYLNSGKKEVAQSNWREAEFFFRSAVERANQFAPGDPRICESLRWLASVLEELGKHDEARDHYEKALTVAFKQIAPNSAESARAMAKLGDVCFRKEEFGLAKNYYKQALNAFKYSYDNDGATEAQQKLDALFQRIKEDTKWRGWSQ